MKNRKATGGVEIPVALMKALEIERIKVITDLCIEIYRRENGPRTLKKL